MPLLTPGQERKSAQRWARVALVALGLFVLPGSLLLVLVTVPLKRPFTWSSTELQLVAIGLDVNPNARESIPGGFFHITLPASGTGDWGFRWGRRVWLIRREDPERLVTYW